MPSQTPKILVTGASGNVGTELVKRLSALNVPFRAMLRSNRGASVLAGMRHAEVVAGDFDDESSLARALAGIERAFLLTGSSAEAQARQSRFVDVARRTGLSHIVKLSQWAADTASPVRFLRYHAEVEERIKGSGLAYTFLRPNLFMQSLLSFRNSIVNDGQFFAAIGDAPVSLVDVRDIVSVAATALTHEGHQGKTYNITGPQALTHRQIADKFATALGRAVEFQDVSPAVMKEALSAAGFPTWQAEGLIEDYAHYARGEAAAVTMAVESVTGRPARSLDDFARDYAGALS